MTPVTAVMIAYEDVSGTLRRLRGLLKSLHYSRLDAELIVIDNSRQRSWRLAAAVTGDGTYPGLYCWQGGKNLKYGPAMNRAVALALHPHVLYICANHGKAIHPSWPLDLLAPLAEDGVAMAGTLQDSGPPEAMGFSPDLPPIHVQGGIFAARTEALRQFPYCEGEYAHNGSDIHQNFQMVAAGWRLKDVPTIRSVWRAEVGNGSWKYVHRGG